MRHGRNSSALPGLPSGDESRIISFNIKSRMAFHNYMGIYTLLVPVYKSTNWTITNSAF